MPAPREIILTTDECEWLAFLEWQEDPYRDPNSYRWSERIGWYPTGYVDAGRSERQVAVAADARSLVRPVEGGFLGASQIAARLGISKAKAYELMNEMP